LSLSVLWALSHHHLSDLWAAVFSVILGMTTLANTWSGASLLLSSRELQP
uniref:Uncharacterized protein n=1 Tax=Amphimedon queenslandica TaxID=400682 RepID=A0A1X7V7B2_AMPQE